MNPAAIPALPYRPGPLAWAGILAATCLVLFLFEKILWLVVPFVMALLIHYALSPLKYRLLLIGVPHKTAAALVALGAFVLLGSLLFFSLPRLSVEVGAWPELTARYLDGGIRLLTDSVRQLEKRSSLLAHAHVSRELAVQIADLTNSFARKHLPSVAVTLAGWAPSLLLGPFIAFFMLRDGWRFKKFLGRSVPNAYFERTLYLLDQVDRTARVYFVGLLQLTVLDTLCLAFGLWVLGMSSPLLLGLLTAVLAWVPFIGSVIGCVIVVLVAATDFPGNPGMAYGAVLLFVVVRLLDDFVFMPMTIGKSLKMHPLLTVLMIFVGGAVAGVPGLMLVLPVLGVVMVLGESIGMIVTDARLRARHAHAVALRAQAARRGLA